MNRFTFETALDSHNLQISPANGRWYDVRRNGRTRTWKRDPARFEIPIKWAFRETLLVTDSFFNFGSVDRLFRVKPLEQRRAEFIEPPVHTTDMGE